MKAWKEKHGATFTVVSDANFAKSYGVMKSHSSSLPHQYVIDAADMKLVHATGGQGSRYDACTENTECLSGSCATEDICQGTTCESHSDCASGFCSGGNCKGLSCAADGDCAPNGTCGVEGVCDEADCSSGSDCPSLECKSGQCRGTTQTEEAWLDLVGI